MRFDGSDGPASNLLSLTRDLDLNLKPKIRRVDVQRKGRKEGRTENAFGIPKRFKNKVARLRSISV